MSHDGQTEAQSDRGWLDVEGNLPQTLFSELSNLIADPQRGVAGVESLCARHPAHAAAIRELAALAARVLPGNPSEGLPEAIEGFRLCGELGRGGMGVVYLAEQSVPVPRFVALKVVKLGMDTQRVLQRFEVERRALARMEHGNIARLYGAGATASGRPFFVMELIAGVPIHRYCDQHRLPIEARLELLLQVCRGVQHAHQKGIVHRDLKPANVLVIVQDHLPVVKIIDFGLARAIEPDADQVTASEPGALVGTLEYMSPEQAALARDDVDTRSDVYSLGVMLYELLTGELPFPSAELRRIGQDEARRRIREVTPPPPSVRASSSDSHSAASPSQRASGRLPSDLDWIVMKALEKDPARRYATPLALADDLQRFLQHEPVQARPAGGWYSLRKFVRRRRVPLAMAAGFGLLFLAFAMATAWFWLQARSAQRVARLLVHDQRVQDAQARLEKLFPVAPSTIDRLQQWIVEVGEPLVADLPLLEPLLTDISESMATADDPAARFLHDDLLGMRSRLASLAAPSGLVARARGRLAQCESVVDAAREFEATWAQACAAIAAADGVRASMSYGGLRLAPQIGLVPLGMDPHSKLWEFVHLTSGVKGRAVPRRDPGTGRWRITEGTGIVLVLLPPGTFTMGSEPDPSLGQSRVPQFDEQPAGGVTLSAFFLGKYEITQAQWQRLTEGATPSRFVVGTKVRGKHAITWINPVERVSWTEAAAWLPRHELALPTEAQWEYACRAGTRTAFYTGEDASSLFGHVNLADASWGAIMGRDGTESFDDGHVEHAPVGSFQPNPFGLHDMHGNVWEWCQDVYGRYDHGPRDGDGLRAPQQGDRRVNRGGSFNYPGIDGRCPNRNAGEPDNRDLFLGVRAARRVQP